MKADGDVINLFNAVEYPYIDDVTSDIFESFGLPRLGGASGNGWSSFSSLQRCPYLYKVTYLDRFRPSPGKALEVGSVMHTLLALHYSWMVDDNWQLTPEIMKDQLLERGARPESVIEAWRLFSAYEVNYPDDYLYPIDQEVLARDPDGNSCRYDLIARVCKNKFGIPEGIFNVEHKCIQGTEKIRDYSTGKLHTVAELYANRISPVVLSLDETTGKLVNAHANVPVPTKIRDVYEVVLESGRHLKVSDNHPFFTAGGWITAAELTKKDWIALPKSTAGWNGASTLSDAEVAFVGYMLGNGYMPTVSFNKNVGPSMTHFISVIESMGYRERTTPGEFEELGYRCNHRQQNGNDNLTVILSDSADSPARVLLERLGLYESVAATKFVPDELHAIPDRQVPVFLTGLWNTDGCAYLFEERNRDKLQYKIHIEYTSMSEALGAGVQTMLTRMGVPSTLTETYVEYEGTRRPVWYVKIVTREGKRRFLSLIKEDLIKFVNYPIDDVYAAIKDGDDALIPMQLVKRLVPDHELTGNLRDWTQRCNAIERRTLKLHGQKKNSAAIEKILAMEVTWDKVSHVIISGRSMMYDLTVPKTHNFVINDIITHNTSARFSSAVFEGWRNDGEVLGQMMIWKRSGLDEKYGELKGTIVNIIGKQKVPQFHRTVIPIEAWHVDQHLQDLKMWSSLKQLYSATGVWPKARSNCTNKFGTCQLFESCSTNQEPKSLDQLIQISIDRATKSLQVSSDDGSGDE